MNWKICLDIYPNSSAITFDQLQNKNKSANFFLIIRDIPSFFSEADFLNSLKESYPSILNMERFKKNDNYNLPIAKLELTSEEEFNEILDSGVYFQNFYCRTEEFIHCKKPLMCKKCLKFGHSVKNCKNARVCDNCGGDHDLDACSSTILKCVNCSGPHKSTDTICPKYQFNLAKNNNINY